MTQRIGFIFFVDACSIGALNFVRFCSFLSHGTSVCHSSHCWRRIAYCCHSYLCSSYHATTCSLLGEFIIIIIIIIITVAKIKVTLSHKNVAGVLYTSGCRK